MIDEIQKRLLREVADLHDVPEGAYNIRANGQMAGRHTTANIEITTKKDVNGIDIRIKPGTKHESVHIPVVVSESGLKEMVYNDFYIGDDADVVIVAGCGINNCGDQDSEHDGIHRFFLEEGARVKYIEKHVGTGKGQGIRSIDPVTECFLQEDAVLEMDTSQIGGVDRTTRKTKATLDKSAKLVIRERLLTEGKQEAYTDFEVTMNGEGASTNLVSRSVARGESYQAYRSKIVGNAPCAGHSECDAIIADQGRVDASPELSANDGDAALIHEAAIGKIAGEQLLKLRTLGLTEEEAEEQIISGFLK